MWVRKLDVQLYNRCLGVVIGLHCYSEAQHVSIVVLVCFNVQLCSCQFLSLFPGVNTQMSVETLENKSNFQPILSESGAEVSVAK